MRRLQGLAVVWAGLFALLLPTHADDAAVGVVQQAPDAEDLLPRSAVTIDPLFVSSGGERPKGSIHPVVMEIGGAAPGRMRIGILESGLEAVGDQWKAATWSASLVAFQQSDFDWRSTQVVADVFDQRIDGPSAGGLMTVGILSAVRGDRLDPAVTMTGTINPDGTIGPVGGIPYKLEAAAAAGKKKVLIPEFSRVEYDAHTDRSIDLIRHGEQLGLEVVPVTHVRQAYRHFTGAELPRDQRAETLPHPSSAVNAAFEGRIERWSRLQKQACDKYAAMPQHVKFAATEQLMQQSQACLDRAGPLQRTGQLPPAFMELAQSTAFAWAAHEIARYNYTYINRGRDSMLQLMKDTAWLDEQIDKATLQVRAFEPRTLDQLSMYLVACDNYFAALCYQRLGNTVAELNQLMPNLGDEFVILGAAYHTMSWLNCLFAADCITIAESYEGGQPLPDNHLPLVLASFYRQCAAANMAVVNSIQLPKVQDQFPVNDTLAKLALGVVDEHYGTTNLGLTEEFYTISGRIRNSTQSKYCLLGAAINLHTRSAMLVAKYYSLGVERNEDFQIVRVTNESALAEWLRESEDQARRSITALQKRGIDATTCAQIYSIARVQDGRGGLDRLTALQSYFGANVLAQALSVIADTGSIEQPAGVNPADAGGRAFIK